MRLRLKTKGTSSGGFDAVPEGRFRRQKIASAADGNDYPDM